MSARNRRVTEPRRRRGRHRRWGGASGQATVELALLLPVVCGLLVLAFEVGGIVRSQVLLVQLTRQVARDAAVAEADGGAGGGGGAGVDGTAAARAAGLDPARLDVEVGPSDAGGLLTVRASYHRSVGIPLLGIVHRDVRLSSQLTVRAESS